jgi:prolyl-tRNA synthetase
MKMSRFLIPTLKEDPADAEVVSHKLMLRAGMIRKLTAGVYSYLPLGYRSLRKLERIVREEMNAAGAQEVFLPMVQPSELWMESGRWEIYGSELLRFKDRHDRECCLGPTHEEVITDLVRREIRSYRDLPVNLYQIQTKFRDEIRPRFGLMRGREFLMKDGYSFDATEEGAEESYRLMWKAYNRIFERCGLKYRAVEADSGPIGGSFSHEFMVLAGAGEDTIVSCDSCDYAANLEKAEIRPAESLQPFSSRATPKNVETPGMSTVEQVSKFLNVSPRSLIKTIIFRTDSQTVAVLVRGDHEANEIKVKNFLKASEIELADPVAIQDATGGPLGFSGPIGLGKEIQILADHGIKVMESAVVGANSKDLHIMGVTPNKDFQVDSYGDFRSAMEGDPCPHCNGSLVMNRGIEVGHVFKLGVKYSKAMNATFLDGDGTEKFMIMGCYGIGVSRTLAAAIEQSHDEDGIVFPVPIAPFSVIITPVGAKNPQIDQAAKGIYDELWDCGIDALLDDRDERPGVKFKDADLIGIPFRVTVGKKVISDDLVEIRDRLTKEVELVEMKSASEWIRKAIAAKS